LQDTPPPGRHLRLAVSRFSSPALADPACQVAGLTLRLPDGRGAELRVLAGKAGARITDARLTLGLTTFGIPVAAALWATATANRHQTLTIGPRGATTLTIDLTSATAHPVQMPTGAVHLTSYAPRTPATRPLS
jgi:hypothetical protein